MRSSPQEQAFDAERSLVCCVMADPSAVDRVRGIVTGSGFENHAMGDAFDHLDVLRAANTPIGDPAVLITELRRSGHMARLGGIEALRQMLKEIPRAENAEHFAREVARLHRLRQLSALGRRLVDESADPNADPDRIASTADAATASAGEASADVTCIADTLVGLADQMDEDRERGTTAGVDTGIQTLDEMSGGLFPGELIVCGARTSIGKTALAVQVGLDAAKAGARVAFISLEMTVTQLAERVAAAQIGLSLVDIRSGLYTAHDVRRVRDCAEQLRDTNLEIYSSRAASVARIRGISKSMKAKSGLDLVIVDYLQLVDADDRKRPRYEQVTAISGDLKSLALELGTPVIALSQLNRQGEGNEAPTLANLRESGSIEQDADAVWLLHRDRGSAATKLIIAKQRQGSTGTIPLDFDGEHCRFDEPEVPEHEF